MWIGKRAATRVFLINALSLRRFIACHYICIVLYIGRSAPLWGQTDARICAIQSPDKRFASDARIQQRPLRRRPPPVVRLFLRCVRRRRTVKWCECVYMGRVGCVIHEHLTRVFAIFQHKHRTEKQLTDRVARVRLSFHSPCALGSLSGEKCQQR